MALINCPECGKQISDKSPNCIHCGCPIVSDHTEPSVESNINNVVLVFLKKHFKKFIAAVVSIIVVIGIVTVSLTFGGETAEKLKKAEEIVLDKVYEVENLGSFVIKKVSSDSNLSGEKNNGETHIDIECDFTNTTKSKIDIDKFVNVTAKSCTNGAEYTNDNISIEIEGSDSYKFEIEAMVTQRVHFSVAVSDRETDLELILNFNKEIFKFKYKLGDNIAKTENLVIDKTYENPDFAKITLLNVTYSESVLAPKPYKYEYDYIYDLDPDPIYRSYKVSDADETIYIVFDLMYTNLSQSCLGPSDAMSMTACYSNKYIYENQRFYEFDSSYKNISVSNNNDSKYMPNTSHRICAVVEVSKDMIEEEVEVRLDLGFDEFIYKGIPETDRKYVPTIF